MRFTVTSEVDLSIMSTDDAARLVRAILARDGVPVASITAEVTPGHERTMGHYTAEQYRQADAAHARTLEALRTGTARPRRSRGRGRA